MEEEQYQYGNSNRKFVTRRSVTNYNLHSLNFANDQAIFAQNKKDTHYMFHKLHENIKYWHKLWKKKQIFGGWHIQEDLEMDNGTIITQS